MAVSAAVLRLLPCRPAVDANFRRQISTEIRHRQHNNALKHGGYHFQHNYGHGKRHLASLLASLILLAFALHSVLDWIDLRYQALRQKGLARMAFFSDLRTLLNYQCFASWDQFMAFMRNPGKDASVAKQRLY